LKEFVCIEKDFLYDNYIEQTQAQHKSSANHFYKDLGKSCLGDLLVEKKLQSNNGRRNRYIVLPKLEDAQKRFNELQQYEYQWDCDGFDDLLSDDE